MTALHGTMLYTLPGNRPVAYRTMLYVSREVAQSSLDCWQHQLQHYGLVSASVVRLDNGEHVPLITCLTEQLAINLRDDLNGSVDEGMTAADRMALRSLAYVKTKVSVAPAMPGIH